VKLTSLPAVFFSGRNFNAKAQRRKDAKKTKTSHLCTLAHDVEFCLQPKCDLIHVRNDSRISRHQHHAV
jgi:uncharacterized protein (DUF1499 family)